MIATMPRWRCLSPPPPYLPLAGLLPNLLDVLPALFEQSRHSTILFVVSELVKVFGDEAQFDGQLGAILSRLLLLCCASLTSLDLMEEDPELVDDTFLLAERSLHYCPRIVLTPALLPPVLDLAVRGTLIQHREANCSILRFIIRLLNTPTWSR